MGQFLRLLGLQVHLDAADRTMPPSELCPQFRPPLATQCHVPRRITVTPSCMPSCRHLRFSMSAPSHFPGYFSNGISLCLATKPEGGLGLTMTILPLFTVYSEPSQETEATLGISEGIGYRGLFTKALLGWKSNREK